MRFITTLVFAALATSTALAAPVQDSRGSQGQVTEDPHLYRRLTDVVNAVYARGVSDGIQARGYEYARRGEALQRREPSRPSRHDEPAKPPSPPLPAAWTEDPLPAGIRDRPHTPGPVPQGGVARPLPVPPARTGQPAPAPQGGAARPLPAPPARTNPQTPPPANQRSPSPGSPSSADLENAPVIEPL
ncbi:hypothetical protein EIP91_008209 [Steccherinum ochraceum]|uniref:Uncharacterized protein n=1 Tax=Steccherinum ochraceum TaxID=92696 RepID=A0A4R0S0F0_9APHY|nr:hypothetical protein EIP91_008209 [Steccherinum ochraceum]